MSVVARRLVSALVVLLATALLLVLVPVTSTGGLVGISLAAPAHASTATASQTSAAGDEPAILDPFDNLGSRGGERSAAPPATDPDRTPLDAQKLAAAATARQTDKRVEVSLARTATSTLYVNPDGRESVDLAAGPIRVRRGDGWAPVDTTLVPVDANDPSAGVRPRAVPFDLTIGSRTAGLAAITSPEGEIALEWPGTLPEPVLDGPQATYADVVPNGDLVIEATTRGFEQSLILRKRPTEAVELRLPVRLRGLSLDIAADGSLILVDDEGVVRAGGPLPRMWGAKHDAHSMEPVRSAPIATRVEHDGDSTTLVMSPDMSFLTDPATTYPVTIDPPVGLSNGGDVWIQTDYSTNQGTSTELKTGTFDSGGTVARSFIKFSAGPISGKHVLDADFKLYEYHSYSCTGRAVTVYRNATDFNTGTIVWGSGVPGTTGSALASATVAYGYSTSCPDNWVTFSGTNLNTALQDWADGDPNYGMQIRASETDSYGWKRFYSANHGTYVPSLTVTYNTVPAVPNTLTPATNSITNDLTPTLSAKYSDGDAGDTGWVSYEVVRDSDGGLVTGGHGPSVASGSYSTWTVPTNELSDGVRYRWRARNWDGTDYGSYTGWMYYTPDLTPPSGPITAPANGAAVSGSFTLTATPTDATSTVASTEFYATSAGRRILLGTDTSSTGGWSITAESTKIPDGNAVITAEYVDAETNRNCCSPGAGVSVVVDNSSAGAAAWRASTPATEFTPDALVGDVVLETGQLRASQLDNRIKGRGVDAAVTRYFDSRNKTVGLFGRGWHSSLEESVSQRSDGGVNHVSASGRERVFVASGTASGLDVAFWNNTSLSGAPVASRVDSTVNFDWVTGSPQAGVNTDAWSARWSGLVNVPAAGTWTFYTTNDDGSRLTVDDVPVITDWTAHAALEKSGSISLSAGPHRIVLEYFDNTSYASAKLQWAGPGVAKAVIPATSLSHVTGYTTPTGDHDTMSVVADGTVALTSAEQAKTTFDIDGHIAVVTDANGNGIEHRWDANGSPAYVCFVTTGVSVVCDSSTSAFVFTVDSSRRMTGISGSSAAWSYTYDASSRLATATGPTGDSATFGYDTFNRLTSVTNALSEVTQVTYDTSDRVIELRAPRQVAAAVTGRTFSYGSGTATVRSAKSNGISGGGSTTYTLDSSGQATSIVDPLARTESATYDSAHHRLTETDGLNHTTTWTYDSRGNVLTVTSPSSAVVTNTYDSANRLLTSTDAASRTTTKTYDSRGNMLTETNPAGETTAYTYNSTGDRVTMVDPRATAGTESDYTTTWTYNTRGLPLTETNPLGAVRTFTYDARGNELTGKDALNRTTTRTYDGNDQVLSETTHNGEKTTYTYDTALRQVTEVGARGNVAGADPAIDRITTAYWPGGQLKSVTDTLGRVMLHDYDADGNETSVTDPRLAVTTSVYDLAGQLTSTTGPDSSVISYTYDNAGRRASVTTASGTTTTTYDADGNATASGGPGHDANNNPLKTTTTYDASGLVLTVTEPAGNLPGAATGSYRTTNTYDNAGRLLTVTDANSRVTTYTYDKAGNQTSIVDPAGATTTIVYDRAGRETSRTIPATARTSSGGSVANGATASTSVTATQAGTINAILDWTESGSDLDLKLRNSSGTVVASSATTSSPEVLTASVAAGTYTMEAVSISGAGTYTLDRTVPSVGTSTTTYNAAGEVTSSADAAGTTGFTYDAQGRVTSRTLPDSTTQTLVYDVGGRLSTMTTPAGTESYTYDNEDQLLTDTEPGGTVTTYTYDASGNQATITRGSTTTTRTFNSYSRITASSIGGSTSTYSYSPSSTVTKDVSYATGDQDSLTYDADNRVTEIKYKESATATPWQVVHYDRDAQGNIATVTDTTGTPAQLATFGYDGIDRLAGETTELTSGTRTASYTYDVDGNRTGKTVGTAVTTYTYDVSGQLVSRSGADGASTYLHDSAGRLVRVVGADAATYTWDGQNRLTGFTKGSTTATYAYDALGRRTSKTVNGVTTTYIYENDRLLSQTTSGSTISYTHSEGAAPLTLTTSAGTYNYHYDHHGSTIALTDSSHVVVVRYTYDAWGNVLSATGDAALIAANPFTYIGRERVMWDAESGTYYMQHRQYDPTLGRFVSRDPIANDKDLSAYVYAAANPVTHTDPTGLYLPCMCYPKPLPIPLSLMHVTSSVYPWLTRNEGFRRTLYNDPAGHCTIGVGHFLHTGNCNATDRARYPNPLTDAQIRTLLVSDVVNKAENVVKKYVKVTLRQRHFDALSSFVFNVGSGNFASSRLLVRLNRGDYAGVPYELNRWTKAGGVVMRGLVRRRCEEGHVWKYGTFTFSECA